MTLMQRIAREPNAILGVIVAGYGLLVVFGILPVLYAAEDDDERSGTASSKGKGAPIVFMWSVPAF